MSAMSLLARARMAGAFAIISFAVFVLLVRALLPYADRYRPSVESWLSARLGQRVTIGSISADWYRLGPRLTLSDVAVAGDHPDSTIRFGSAKVEFNLLTTLIKGSPQVDDFTVLGLKLFLMRDPNGAISIADRVLTDEEAGTAKDWAENSLIAWMLAQRRLALRDCELVWIDRAAGTGYTFTGVRLDARNRGDRHQIEGSAALPETLGGQLSFAADLRGTPGSPDWRMHVYVDGSELSLGGWLGSAVPQAMHIAGLATVRVWSEWSPEGVQAARGTVLATNLRIDHTVPSEAFESTPTTRESEEEAGRDGTPTTRESEEEAGRDGTPTTRESEEEAGRDETASEPAAVSLDADSLAGPFSWRRTASGWRLDTGDIAIGWPGGASSHHRLGISSDRTGDDRSLTIHVDQLPLDLAARLLALSDHPPPWLRGVAAAHPQGSLRDVELRAGGGDRYSFAAGIDDLAIEPSGRIPGLRGITGRLTLDQTAGAFELQGTRPAEVYAKDLFRGPLTVAHAEGEIRWMHDDTGWRVSIPGVELRNDDLAVQLRGRLDLPAGSDPFLALFARFEVASLRPLAHYLPAGIMPASTVRWLDASIIDGVIPRGELIFNGPVKDFPFDHHEGLFRVDFDVGGGVLEYAPEWPRIGEIDANLVFEGRRMSIRATHGTSLATAITRADVTIDDLAADSPVLAIAGVATGETRKMLRFLSDTPLSNEFGPFVRGVKASGASRLDLALRLPLGDGKTVVDGAVEFKDSELAFAGGAVNVSHLQGALKFTRSGLEARRLRASVFGFPATVRVRSTRSSAGIVTAVDARGGVGGDALARMLHLRENDLQGATQWSARIEIPDAGHLNATGLRVRIDSDLKGLGAALADPLRKPADAAWPLRIEMALPAAHDRPITVTVADRATAVFALGGDAGFERGEVRFGGGDEPSLSDQPGLHLSGLIDRFDADAWRHWLGDKTAATGLPLRGFDLDLRQVDLFGRTFHDARVMARNDAGAWTFDIQSREVAGTVVIPAAGDAQWRVRLRYLYLEKPNSSGLTEGLADPRTLPALSLECERFRYGITDFGQLRLTASRTASGVALDDLALSSSIMKIDAKGEWSVVNERQVSSFEIGFSSSDFGRALSALGYAGSIAGGKAKSTIAARWDGAPAAFSLDRMDGSMSIEVSGGRLLDVEPGAARVFGLVSLQALPRRLMLDFSDFFGKGFGFDRIAGHFTIKDGVASTTDLTMTGPAASFAASGDVNLVSKEYDQIVTVTPNLTSGLPVAGVVAGGLTVSGLGVGAAIFAMERMLRSDIDRVTKITYRVSGPWSDPYVVRLQEGVQSGKN
jgi:uncharacterized protein (TIGR02099 family)